MWLCFKVWDNPRFMVYDKLAGLAVLGGLYPQIETNPRRNIDSIVDICHDIIISHDLL